MNLHDWDPWDDFGRTNRATGTTRRQRLGCLVVALGCIAFWAAVVWLVIFLIHLIR